MKLTPTHIFHLPRGIRCSPTNNSRILAEQANADGGTNGLTDCQPYNDIRRDPRVVPTLLQSYFGGRDLDKLTLTPRSIIY